MSRPWVGSSDLFLRFRTPHSAFFLPPSSGSAASRFHAHASPTTQQPSPTEIRTPALGWRLRLPRVTGIRILEAAERVAQTVNAGPVTLHWHIGECFERLAKEKARVMMARN